jgi:hypothetical protein
MDVILAMTFVAVRRQLQIHRILGGVARLTRHLSMRAGQWIFGLRRMVEAPSRPAVGIVASRTIGSKASLVLVVVTFSTSKRRVFEGRRLMTFRTRDPGMQPDQRETSQIMVKSSFLAPIVFIVALLASRTERVFVGIIFLVA